MLKQLLIYLHFLHMTNLNRRCQQNFSTISIEIGKSFDIWQQTSFIGKIQVNKTYFHQKNMFQKTEIKSYFYSLQ